MKNSLYLEIEENNSEINTINESIKNLNKIKKEYTAKKNFINSKYYELMKDRQKIFWIKGSKGRISFHNIKNVITAGGSNKPIITIMWYMNLLKIKNEFNSKAIKFPLVLDSPE